MPIMPETATLNFISSATINCVKNMHIIVIIISIYLTLRFKSFSSIIFIHGFYFFIEEKF